MTREILQQLRPFGIRSGDFEELGDCGLCASEACREQCLPQLNEPVQGTMMHRPSHTLPRTSLKKIPEHSNAPCTIRASDSSTDASPNSWRTCQCATSATPPRVSCPGP